jgi:hypothetical protein
MNERIKELLEQSGFRYVKDDGIGWAGNYNASLPRFAELMINDCIKELEISRRGDPYTGNLYDCEYNTCINEQIQILKARFGVK